MNEHNYLLGKEAIELLEVLVPPIHFGENSKAEALQNIIIELSGYDFGDQFLG